MHLFYEYFSKDETASLTVLFSVLSISSTKVLVEDCRPYILLEASSYQLTKYLISNSQNTSHM